ncbi:MAG TPA: FAD-dependent oxidoreductase, partial [Candidatus Acidoferrum sp.]|nr:FAD-dependent oxidoreductase [Candidatus Acidoferrum sp.]
MDSRMRPTARRRQPVRYVILGNSTAGIAAAQEIRRHDPEGQITIVSDEKVYGYSRAMLSLYIAGKKTKRDIVFAPREFYGPQKIRLLRGVAAEAIDACGRQVHLSSGKSLPYDRLLVATGSSSRILNVPGKELPGIFPLRKFTDAEAIKRSARSSRGPVVIVGGGLVGVKSLEAMAGRKREIHLVISSDRILSQMLDRRASDHFLRAFERRGVRVHLHTDVTAFHGTDKLQGVSLSDGTQLDCDLAIVGKGVDPNVGCLKGTAVDLAQGVIVDDHMATNIPSIFAAGDVAEPVEVLQRKNLPSTIWPSATEGGRIAGLNMAGVPATFSGALRMNSVEILGVRVI